MLAVLVLYKVAAKASPAFASLWQLLAADPAAAACIELAVYDNSPYEQVRPPGYTGLYRTDTANPGLARCYNAALEIAERQGIPWLMLLDQDTTLTAEYLREVLAETRQLEETQGDTARVVALVPKLLEGGRVQSPHYQPTYKHTAVDRVTHGVAAAPLLAFNSGSVIRVPALRAIGGFPLDFWLDFLDHATFHLLQARGDRLFVLKACLSHELSTNDRVQKTGISRERYENVLSAERLFYRRYGTALDRAYVRIRLLRISARTLLVSRRPVQALQALKAAVRF